MKHPRVSSYSIIAKVKRDFGINTSGWIGDAVEWIGEVLQETGHRDGFETDHADVSITDNRGEYPCNYYMLLGVEYEGRRLRQRTSVRPANRQMAKYQNGNTDQTYLLANLETHLPEIRALSRLPDSKSDYYQSGTYLETSFATGTVRLYYLAFPLDENGFPLIPDVQNLKNAMAWYILSKWLANGNTHPSFDYQSAEARYNEQVRKAKGYMKYPSPDERAAFTSMWTSIVRNADSYSSFHEGTQEPSRIRNV